MVATFLQQRGLELSPEKTRITQIENGVDFLGHHVRQDNGKLFIKPSTKSIHARLDNVRGVIKTPQHATAGATMGYASYSRSPTGGPTQNMCPIHAP